MLEVKPLGGLHEITRTRSSQMHERGHTYYGTVCPERCSTAATWAARRLIAPRAFLAAARHEHRLDYVAAALSVTPEDVRAYLADLTVNEWLIMQRLVGHELV